MKKENINNTKKVYHFSRDYTEGNKGLKDLLGGKGANLAEMSALGLNVPAGFTITTLECLEFQKTGKLSEELKEQVIEGVKRIEKITGKSFGSIENPLLFSIRSGAKISMPGMMDTVLNLGINDESVIGLAKQTCNSRYAWDSYRRFIQMYSNVVLGFNTSLLDSFLEDLKDARNVLNDFDLNAEDLKELCKVFKQVILTDAGISFPSDPYSQLWRAIEAVFNSWSNPRAYKYREINNIDHNIGTAVNVQSMVFGNMGDDCATGVCFTRDPSTGEKKFFGEFLINAQGEDVVAGIRTPSPINEESRQESNKDLETLEQLMPEVFNELCDTYQKLENHYLDMQDIEFTIEKNKLYLLQTRNGKRTAAASIKIAIDLVEEGVISKEEAISRIDAESLNQLLHPRLDPDKSNEYIAKGLPASPGAASGFICFDSNQAKDYFEQGKKVILVRHETSPEDIVGMASSQGILTQRGGMTSHAAVVARGMGKPCVAGCSEMTVDYQNKSIKFAEEVFKAGDFLTIDGGTGKVFKGIVPTIEAGISSSFKVLMAWAQEIKVLKVRANADNARDSKMAIRFGAEGIGLCRTEHMFFGDKKILAMREMIFASNQREREEALSKIYPFQKEDFLEIFEVMDGRPVNIRLLDPPLHEFLPNTESEKEELADILNLSLAEINERSKELHEFNPMLGHRGCRLAISYPQISKVQVKAIGRALKECNTRNIFPKVEIMVPLIIGVEEFSLLKNYILEQLNIDLEPEIISKYVKIGTMIEMPRAALLAHEIAKESDFFSFGTNDLTQTTMGLSRDDAGRFLKDYYRYNIFKEDPFVSLDLKGVGVLVKKASEDGRDSNKKIHLGICGEHGGDPKSIHFFHEIGLDYISCSPYRVPIAILSAAQANIKNRK